VREIDATSLLDISDNLTVEDYNTLRRKLEINVQLERDNFQPQENEEYKSPRNLVSIPAAHGDANRETVKKLFATQYEFKWRTETGDPDQFSFYGFCQDLKNAGGEDVMTYDKRKAHVISRLYHAQEKLHKIRHLTHRQLCPPVYVRTAVDKRWTWKKWICNRDRSVFEVTDGETDIDWITNIPLRNYITKYSVQNDHRALFPNGGNHIYWAVLEEDDFGENQPHAAHGNNLGTTQVYVGKAMHGIKDRWVANTKSHCRNMELSRNVMYNMMNYDQNTLEGQQLVDLRFLLHKADTYHQERQVGDRCGLFIMGRQGYGDGENVERRNIEGARSIATRKKCVAPDSNKHEIWNELFLNSVTFITPNIRISVVLTPLILEHAKHELYRAAKPKNLYSDPCLFQLVFQYQIFKRIYDLVSINDISI
jgi:hypothetical protein